MNDEFLLSVRQFLEEKGYWEIFIYLFFGGLATVVNIVTFAIALQMLHLSMPIANTIFLDLFCFICFCNEQIMGISFQVT